MENVYHKNINVSYTCVDRSARMGLAECLAFNQDMLTEYCGMLGTDNIVLKEKNNAAWIYTRTKFCAKRLPGWNEKLHGECYITNWSPVRIEIETCVSDERGEKILLYRTQMCAIDLGDRSLRKIDSVEFPGNLPKAASEYPDRYGKLTAGFSDEDFVYSAKVFASDTDFTRHTNNVRYAKFLCNTLGGSFYDSCTVCGFEIQYLKESREGDELGVYRKETSPGEYSFLIKCGDAEVVRAVLFYRFNQDMPRAV